MAKKTYKTHVEQWLEARIDSDSVAAIIEEEIDALIGGRDRYIDTEGRIMEEDYRFNNADYIRDATEEEKELYRALRIASSHFKKGRRND